MNWLKDRVKEMSSWSGASLIVLGAFIILGGPFIKLLAWAAIIWGIVSIVKKDKVSMPRKLDNKFFLEERNVHGKIK